MGILNSGASGFYNAPVSKVLFCASIATTILASVLNTRKSGHAIGSFRLIDVWRFFSSPFVFSSYGEMFFGLILIYIYRLFERQWGSQKYAMFVTVTTFLTYVLQFGAFALFTSNKYLWSGLYGIIFSNLAQYIMDVPSTNPFRILGIPLSEKFFVYLISLQLLLANTPNSTIIGICGLIAGFIYRSDIFRVKSWRFPAFIVSFFRNRVFPLIQSSPPVTHRRRQQQHQQDDQLAAIFNTGGAAARNQDDGIGQGNADTLLGDTHGVNMRNLQRQQLAALMQGYFGMAGANNNNTNTPGFRNQNEEANQVQAVQPSEENIATLMAMGFAREAVVEALTATGDDVHRATELLLSA